MQWQYILFSFVLGYVPWCPKEAESELLICFLPKQFCAISLVDLVLIEYLVPQIQTFGFQSCTIICRLRDLEQTLDFCVKGELSDPGLSRVRECTREWRTKHIIAFFPHAWNLAMMNHSKGISGSWVGAQDLTLRVPALEGMGELTASAVSVGWGKEWTKRPLPCTPPPTPPRSLGDSVFL